ncbi:hypothetical protein R4227_06070 [Gordonia amicalis]|nr:hypothetical protein [Gordonia amicalis]MDV7099708.1 hypothetical protein [Gordonia amicalis]
MTDPRFASSESRPQLFEGLLRYLRDWELAQEVVGTQVLKAVWIGGGFTSGKVETEDIDVSPIVDSRRLAALRGVAGNGRLRALYSQRSKVRAEYGVEPFVVLWSPFTTLKLKNMDVGDHEYVAVRGMMDDFWQRTTESPLKIAMTEEDAEPTRGYLEVEL